MIIQAPTSNAGPGPGTVPLKLSSYTDPPGPRYEIFIEMKIGESNPQISSSQGIH